MLNAIIANGEGIAVGDRVWIIDSMVAGERGAISAEVIDTRRILGEQTYLIETEMGDRKLVGANQIGRVEPSKK
jgi:hypothetical protein